MCFCEAGDPAKPASIRDVLLKTDGGAISLRMILIPPQPEVSPDGASDPSGKERLAQPFYFAATELTLAGFNALASKETRASHDAIEAKMASQADQKKDWAAMQSEAASYAAKMVSLGDAASITAAATLAFEKSSSDRGPTLVRERFRLPTAAEWRHAMSMGSQPQAMHINPWPALERDLTGKERGRCAELWTASGGQGQFIGSPEQVRWVIERASSNTEQRLELLTIFTRFLLSGRLLDPKKSNSHSWEIQPEPLAERIDAAPGNQWGILGAHRGYPEWVISTTSQTDALGLWRKCESNACTDSDRQRPAFGLCGAASFTLNKNDLKPMLQAFISHESAVIDGRPFFSWQEADENELFIDRSVTLRLVLIESLADDWVSLIRSNFANHVNATTTAAAAKPFLAEVARLTHGSERTRNQAVINCFLAISEYRCGAGEDAAKRLAENAAQASGNLASAEDIAARFRRAQGSAGSSRPTSGSPDGLYLRSVARLMARDELPNKP